MSYYELSSAFYEIVGTFIVVFVKIPTLDLVVLNTNVAIST